MYKFPGDSFFHDLLYLKQTERNDCMIPTKSAQHLGVSVSTTACPFPLTNRLITPSHHILQGRMDLRRESTNKPEGLIMGWGNLWQNKDRSAGVCPHKRLNYFSMPIAPSKSLLQHNFQRAVQDFLYDSSLAFTVSSAHETRLCCYVPFPLAPFCSFSSTKHPWATQAHIPREI